MSKKHELIITALQQRIGEIAASYETQIAVLRADLTMAIDAKDVDNFKQTSVFEE
jgi:hypothetical protein